MGHPGERDVQPDLLHGLLEQKTVFPLLNRFRVGPDELDPVFLQSPASDQVHGGIKGGLAAEGGENGIRALAFDDLLNGLGGDRLNVSARGELRVGHDGGRVGVNEHDFIAFFGEGFAGLDA